MDTGYHKGGKPAPPGATGPLPRRKGKTTTKDGDVVVCSDGGSVVKEIISFHRQIQPPTAHITDPLLTVMNCCVTVRYLETTGICSTAPIGSEVTLNFSF
eukprot:scaffold7381_cov310-Pinguiococcus_pyrenoidosus.AAC.91